MDNTYSDDESYTNPHKTSQNFQIQKPNFNTDTEHK